MANFVNLLDIVYPVGSVYISTNAASPSNSIGGTWTAINNAILAASGSDYTAASGFGGNKAMTVEQMPSHTHDMNYSLAPNTLALPSNTGNWYVFDKQWSWICPRNPVNSTGGQDFCSIPLFNVCMETNSIAVHSARKTTA